MAVMQDRRKDLGLDFTDRIEIGVVGASAELQEALEQHGEFLCGETLGIKLTFEALPGVEGIAVEIGDEKVVLYVRRV